MLIQRFRRCSRGSLGYRKSTESASRCMRLQGQNVEELFFGLVDGKYTKRDSSTFILVGVVIIQPFFG